KNILIIPGLAHGKSATEAQSTQRKDLENNLRVLGDSVANLNSEMLASAYAACDVFVLPSFYETPGLAALEAGLAGAKIVITKYGGTDEYFGDYAEYIDPKKVQSIYQGLVRALAKKKDRILAEHIRTNFLWEKSAKKLIEIYTTINVC
ncbi:MAG: glycosyltransferase, partial [bacterium]